MATITTLTDSGASLTLVRAYTTGTPTGKRSKVKQYTFGAGASDTITVGGLTNTILATNFGLTRIERVSNIVVYTTSTGASVKVYPAVPTSDGAGVTTANPYDSTDATRGNAADITVGNSQSGMITVEGV